MAKKSEVQKALKDLAKQRGAVLNNEGADILVHRPGERFPFRVTPQTDAHAVDRYLRGVAA